MQHIKKPKKFILEKKNVTNFLKKTYHQKISTYNRIIKEQLHLFCIYSYSLHLELTLCDNNSVEEREVKLEIMTDRQIGRPSNREV